MKRIRRKISDKRLEEDDVNKVLELSSYFKSSRKRKQVSEDYRQKLNNKANSILNEWIANGVPAEIWINMSSSFPSLPTKYSLVAQNGNKNLDDETVLVAPPSNSSNTVRRYKSYLFFKYYILKNRIQQQGFETNVSHSTPHYQFEDVAGCSVLDEAIKHKNSLHGIQIIMLSIGIKLG